MWALKVLLIKHSSSPTPSQLSSTASGLAFSTTLTKHNIHHQMILMSIYIYIQLNKKTKWLYIYIYMYLFCSLWIWRHRPCWRLSEWKNEQERKQKNSGMFQHVCCVLSYSNFRESERGREREFGKRRWIEEIG